MAEEPNTVVSTGQMRVIYLTGFWGAECLGNASIFPAGKHAVFPYLQGISHCLKGELV